MNKVQSSKQYQMGIHSKIPKCCVLFFCELDIVISSNIIVRLNMNRKLAEIKLRGRKKIPEYVMCPSCFYQFLYEDLVRVEIHYCDDSCRQFKEGMISIPIGEDKIQTEIGY